MKKLIKIRKKTIRHSEHQKEVIYEGSISSCLYLLILFGIYIFLKLVQGIDTLEISIPLFTLSL